MLAEDAADVAGEVSEEVPGVLIAADATLAKRHREAVDASAAVGVDQALLREDGTSVRAPPDRALQSLYAGVVQLVDTPALGAGARKSLGVRVPPPAFRGSVESAFKPASAVVRGRSERRLRGDDHIACPVGPRLTGT